KVFPSWRNNNVSIGVQTYFLIQEYFQSHVRKLLAFPIPICAVKVHVPAAFFVLHLSGEEVTVLLQIKNIIPIHLFFHVIALLFYVRKQRQSACLGIFTGCAVCLIVRGMGADYLPIAKIGLV